MARSDSDATLATREVAEEVDEQFETGAEADEAILEARDAGIGRNFRLVDNKARDAEPARSRLNKVIIKAREAEPGTDMRTNKVIIKARDAKPDILRHEARYQRPTGKEIKVTRPNPNRARELEAVASQQVDEEVDEQFEDVEVEEVEGSIEARGLRGGSTHRNGRREAEAEAEADKASLEAREAEADFLA